MSNEKYIEAFDTLARELAAHPKIELLGYHTFSALSLREIANLEEQYNCQLDEDIRAFYKQSNGLQLLWILKSNPNYNPQKYQQFHENTAPVSWCYASGNFEKEDGCLIILPLEEVLRKVVSPNIYQEDIRMGGRIYSSIDFHACIRPFDSFSYYCNMALFLRKNQAPLVLMGDEQGTCFIDSKWTTFGTYLDFVLASKALCSRRKEFFGQSKGYQDKIIKKLPRTLQQKWSLETLILVQDFPLADQLGSPSSHIETQKMQEKACQKEALNQAQVEQLIIDHQDFLHSGGIGGEWQIIAIKGQALGVYKGKKYEKGKQAILDMQKIDNGLDLKELQLPYSSWCGVYAKLQDFSKADFMGSIMTDANLEMGNFAEANLENVDFSRSNLKGASFVNANLIGADFENCNLTGADFRGAVLTGSQFKGAILREVLR